MNVFGFHLTPWVFATVMTGVSLGSAALIVGIIYFVVGLNDRWRYIVGGLFIGIGVGLIWLLFYWLEVST